MFRALWGKWSAKITPQTRILGKYFLILVFFMINLEDS